MGRAIGNHVFELLTPNIFGLQGRVTISTGLNAVLFIVRWFGMGCWQTAHFLFLEGDAEPTKVMGRD